MLNFSMVVWTVLKDGTRIPDAEPILFLLETPIQDFRFPTRGFPQGYWWNAQLRLSTNVMEQITSQATPIGPLAALSEKYAKRKRHKYGDQPILIATGGMLADFFEGPNHIFEEGPKGMKWGNRNPLIGYHFRGHATPTPLPRRPLGMPPDEFGPTVRSDAVRYCAERYREQGFRLAAAVPSETPLATLTRAQATAGGRAYFGSLAGGMQPLV